MMKHRRIVRFPAGICAVLLAALTAVPCISAQADSVAQADAVALTDAVPLTDAVAQANAVALTDNTAQEDNTAPIDAAVKLPEWVPQSFDSALEFRNRCGATLIRDNLLCVVYVETEPYAPEEYPDRYSILETAGIMAKTEVGCYEYVPEEEDSPFPEMMHSDFRLAVVLYEPLKAGDFQTALADRMLNEYSGSGSEFDTDTLRTRVHYEFRVDGNLGITETDLWGWLPDCMGEFDAYEMKEGTLSAHGNYAVYCQTEGIGTPYRWLETEFAEGVPSAAPAEVVPCNELSVVQDPGGRAQTIYLYSREDDGPLQFCWKMTSVTGEDADGMPAPVRGDFMAVNGGKTVLAKGDALVTVLDSRTDQPFDFSALQNGRFLLSAECIDPADTPEQPTEPVQLALSENPAVLRAVGSYLDGSQYTLDLIAEKTPLAYPEDTKLRRLKTYDNGAYSLTVTVRPGDIVPEPGQTRVSFIDRRTGDLLNNHFTEGAYIVVTAGAPEEIAEDPSFEITANPALLGEQFTEVLGREGAAFNVCFKQGWVCERTEERQITGLTTDTYAVRVYVDILQAGDLNGDGELSAADAVLLSRWLTGDETAIGAENWRMGDMNSDYLLDVRDLTLLKQWLLQGQHPLPPNTESVMKE